MNVPWNEKQTVVIDLDGTIVEIVKDGKHYSLDGFLNEKFEAFLAMRLREKFEEKDPWDDWDDYDYCYECRGYGDDYYFDEDGELISACEECLFNGMEDEE